MGEEACMGVWEGWPVWEYERSGLYAVGGLYGSVLERWPVWECM